MNDEHRFVFDAGVIVSALLFEGAVPGLAFHHALARGTILLSNQVVEELNDVLSRPKFDRYVTRDEREAFLVKLVQRSSLVDVREDVRVCRDPKDDK